MGQPSLFYVYFCLFRITQFNILMKEYMVCLGLEPGATGWKGQTNPLSYGGTPNVMINFQTKIKQKHSLTMFTFLTFLTTKQKLKQCFVMLN